ncbi:type VI secretion system contractile sheath small subunit [Planctellipticum variicoloris]|uniref:type VI secretion system contractile sheath small subunit n=1 Tax=Planctellipticum variicoloris TaxID=3064265 RepID=UPI0030141C3E|nr:type VI secretion system contractile sheath small subunit [Planctomycetaceae bacterium SH412]
MAKESLQKKLDRVRPPRVQIKYEVYVGDAMEMKELPFVVGVLGDFSGKPEKSLPALKDRKFVDIDRDNFNKVLGAMAPRLAMQVDDTISGQADQKLNVELKFQSMDDFSPENVVKQIPLLRALLEQRENLKNLSSRLEGNDKLDELLQQVLANSDLRASLAKELGTETPPPAAP